MNVSVRNRWSNRFSVNAIAISSSPLLLHSGILFDDRLVYKSWRIVQFRVIIWHRVHITQNKISYTICLFLVKILWYKLQLFIAQGLRVVSSDIVKFVRSLNRAQQLPSGCSSRSARHVCSFVHLLSTPSRVSSLSLSLVTLRWYDYPRTRDFV